jgi:hypothetical protein
MIKPELIAATILILSLTSAANAIDWSKIEQPPCGSNCPQPLRAMPPDKPKMRYIEVPNCNSRSQTVIQSRYGTSVINSTHCTYSLVPIR